MCEATYEEILVSMQGDCDMDGKLKISAFLRYAQQVATNHTDRLGYDEAFYRAQNVVFLLAKQALSVQRLPRANEMLRFVTTPEKSRRAANKRITTVYDEHGEEMACFDSRWILVDPIARKIIRRPPPALEVNWLEDVAREVEMKYEKPTELVSAGTCVAAYSLCDCNRHINNARYVDIALDCVPRDVWAAYDMTRVVVQYHREVLYGESMTLHWARTEQGLYVVGKKGELLAFELFCRLKSPKTQK